MYEEKLGGEFSTLHFQALKAKVSALSSGASGLMRVWNVAWLQCQDLRQHFEAMHKKKCADKNQFKPTATARPQENDGGMDKREKGSEEEEDECSLTQLSTSVKDGSNVAESTTAASVTQSLKAGVRGESQVQTSVEHVLALHSDCYPATQWKPRGHHSEADLRSSENSEAGDGFPSHKVLGRSLSEGSCASSGLTSISDFLPLNVRHKHCQSRTQPLEHNLQLLQNLHFDSLQQENLSCKSKDGCGASTQSSRDPFPLREINESNVL